MRLLKTPSTPSDQSVGILNGIQQLIEETGVAASDIVALLHRHASDALAQPNIRQRVIDMGGVVPGGTAADFGRFMAEDTERWAKVIKVAGIKVN